ncbi:BAH domain-containing protein [Pochonia chlamydosporia 170]|uniref:BAH domain-containing protein n=1 Tax=Pochonia chlamydosporia 170 TaxID=1380566 RepID=A0A179EXR9_METCM|nr:BAH domain-containing protein [Pochonia chlamydosporia 170]OAQ57643.1 BAH domain-containing protein [Pochonia chlamydosporia 170]
MGRKSRKRRRCSIEEGRVGCPFTVITLTDQSSERTSEKRKQHHGDKVDRQFTQLSPFKPQGKFISNQSMDMSYTIEPLKRWQDMTRYHTFILNGHTYRTDDFVYVGNDNSIKAQKAACRDKDRATSPQLTQHWVAKVLEIRAADENHVYARVYWMYSPDELPPNTRHGEETIEGRQPYHGKNEVIASNHMDIINVVSVVTEALVHQWIESNDDETHDTLYWRQAFNVATLELSSAELICNCRTPAHPEELLVGCTSQDCGQWLHEKCLRDAVLKRVYDRLGGGKQNSPENVSDITLTVSQTTPPSSLVEGGKDPSNLSSLKMSKITSNEIYDGLFTAALNTKDGPMHWEITDHRQDRAENSGTWMERVDCLTCGTTLD